MKRVEAGGKHCELLANGWTYSENEEGTGAYYSFPSGFDSQNLCLSDAYQLHKMIEAWGK